MKIIDPHIDIADIYKYFGYSLSEFFAKNSNAPVTLSKIRKTNIDIVGFSLYFDKHFVKTSFYDGVKEFYRFYQKLLSKTDKFYLIKSSKDLKNKPKNKIGFFYSIEGFECFRIPDDFDEFYKIGVRSFGFTWDFDNKYACGRYSKNDKGITRLGRQVIKKMNRKKKIIVDIAHLSEQSIRDLDRYYSGMIVTTHSNVRSIYNTLHNLKDDEIQIIVDRGGIVSLFPLVSDTGGRGTFEELYEHFDYIVNKWGIDYVGFASDIYPAPEYPFLHDYKDILVLKHLQEFFSRRLSKKELEKVMYKNWIRVLLSRA